MEYLLVLLLIVFIFSLFITFESIIECFRRHSNLKHLLVSSFTLIFVSACMYGCLQYISDSQQKVNAQVVELQKEVGANKLVLNVKKTCKPVYVQGATLKKILGYGLHHPQDYYFVVLKDGTSYEIRESEVIRIPNFNEDVKQMASFDAILFGY